MEGELDDVTEVYNCAGAYRFGMSADEARRANVDSVRAIVAFAARLPRLRRLVHVSGYRVGRQDPLHWSEERRREAYRALGAYEASKVEADAVFQTEAERLGVPWSIVNPASVIGDSVTGESGQYLGLASTLRDLWQGRLAAVPGNARTFVPVVAVDYLARFMALLPLDETAERASYWLLDDDTPALPGLIALVAEHYRVRAPRVRVPVALVKRLPRRLTKADPETLTFLSADRYPTGSARAFAARHGLTMPDTATTIRRWADHLAASRFGDAPADGRRFTGPGGVRTFELGEPAAPTVVLPGLPVNADTWAPVVAALGRARGGAATAARLLAVAASPRWRADLRAELARYPGHVHVVVGSRDPLGPEGRALLDALPRATVTVIPGTGHHPQLTHPEDVAQAVGAWNASPGAPAVSPSGRSARSRG
nr:SDR family oxidoreductase [Microbispora sitophila]